MTRSPTPPTTKALLSPIMLPFLRTTANLNDTLLYASFVQHLRSEPHLLPILLRAPTPLQSQRAFMMPSILDIQPHRLLLKLPLVAILGAQVNIPVISDSAAKLHAVARVAGQVDADVLVLRELVDVELLDIASVLAIDEDGAVKGVVRVALEAGVGDAGDGDTGGGGGGEGEDCG